MNSSKLQTKVTSMGKNAEHCMYSSKLQTKVTSMGKNADQYFNVPNRKTTSKVVIQKLQQKYIGM